jgi:Flp pilus assembly protein TadD
MVLPEHNGDAILKSRFFSLLSNPVFLGLILAATTLIVFWPATRCDFLNFDDPDYFTANPHVLSGLTADNFTWAFTTGHASNWHPLTWLSLMLDVELFGKTPFGPHLVNLLFHAVNTALLFLLLRKLTAATWRSAFVAALFALHPLHVESVAWISERKDVLSTFFALLSLWAYAGHAQKFKSPGAKLQPAFASLNFWLSLFFFALALMSKPMLVTMPFVLLLLDWWPLQRTFNLGLFLEKIPFFALSIISCVVTFIVQQKGGAVETFERFSLTGRVENAFVSYARYLGKTFWPEPLAVPYPSGHWELSVVIYSVALLAGVSALAVLFARRFPFVFTGWFWFAGTLVPVIGLVQVGVQSMADRYAYVPLIGLFIVIAWGAHAVALDYRVPKPWIIFLAATILILCASRTREQLGYWRNSETLFSHTLAVTKNNYVAYNNLGTCLSIEGNVPAAVVCFQKALQIKPDNADTLYNLGNALMKLGDTGGAIADYHRALQFDSTRADLLNNLGLALMSQKQIAEATTNFESALELDPDSAEAHNNLATVLFIQRRFAEAAQHYRAALRLTPDDPQIHANLGDTLVRLGQPAEAVQNYQTALRLNPNDTRTMAKLQALGAQTSN